MERTRMNCVYVFLFLLLIHHCVGPPTQQKHTGNSTDTEEKPRLDDLGLEYNRYLMEVVEALESDPEFRKKLEHAEEADFRSGKIAAELEFVNHNVRNKLDELKRTELQRLRDLVHQAEEIEKNEINPNHVNPGHVDHVNPHTFESADLHKLITQVRKDLDEADRKRREEFKEYEMQKKFEQEQKIKVLDEEHKKQYLHELEEQKKKHQQHEPLHHPGSKAQLEEVWEKTDHMEQQQFNPRTFFVMHDLNGDGYWDEEEVSALFVKELNKLYTPGAPEDDMKERHEEMERMREHVFKETDTNRDRLISYNEFLEQTKKQEFNKDEGWETLDSQPQFTQQEYEEFERRRMQEIQDLIDRGLIQPYAPGMMPPPPHGYAQHPGQFQQHPPVGAHPNQMPPQQYGQNVGYHPQQGVPQYHPQGVPVQHQQGVPIHHQQGLPIQHQQGVPVQQHQQGVPVQHQQGVPVQQGVPMQHHQQGAPVQQGVPVQQHQQGAPVQQGVPMQQQQQGAPVQQGVPMQQHQQGAPVQQGVPMQQHQQGAPVQQGVPMQQHQQGAPVQQGVPVQQYQQGVPVQQQQQGSQHPQGVPQQGQYQYQAPPQKIAQPPQALPPNPVPGVQKQPAQQQQYYNNQIPNQGQINQQPQVAAGQQHQSSPQQNQIDTDMNKNNIPKN